ncbi:kinase domain-containing protein [Nemania sp. FL0916]|nr:kinase domain-containing protein [Nemania sp. FL0916]
MSSSSSTDSSPPIRDYRFPRLTTIEVEGMDKYAPGGFHPIAIPSEVGSGLSRFKILHKLGYGGFSTIWLVRSNVDGRYYALKILCANIPRTNNELAILWHLKTVAPRGHPNVVMLHETFIIKGPNGEHRCLLFPVLGPSLRTVDVGQTLLGEGRERVCRQVASGLAFLHEHGICHGDLSRSNIAFELPDFNCWDPSRVDRLFGPVESETVEECGTGEYSKHCPDQLIKTTSLPGLDKSMLKNVKIIDFGEAFFLGKPPSTLGTPIHYFPPEICFGYAASLKTDIWSLACVLYEIHSRSWLFPGMYPVFESIIGTIVDVVGPLPESWKGRFRFDMFGEPGREGGDQEPGWWYEDKDSPQPMPLDQQLFAAAPHLNAAKRAEFIGLLLDMLAYEPEKRLDAAGVSQRLNKKPPARHPLPTRPKRQADDSRGV